MCATSRVSPFLLFRSRWPVAVWWSSTWLRSTIGRLPGPSTSCSSGPGWALSSTLQRTGAGLFWMVGPCLRRVRRLSSATVTRTWCLPAPTMRTRTGSALRGLPSPGASPSWPFGPFRLWSMFSVAGAPAPGCWIPSRPGWSCRRTRPLRPRSSTVSCGRVRAPAGLGRVRTACWAWTPSTASARSFVKAASRLPWRSLSSLGGSPDAGRLPGRGPEFYFSRRAAISIVSLPSLDEIRTGLSGVSTCSDTFLAVMDRSASVSRRRSIPKTISSGQWATL